MENTGDGLTLVPCPSLSQDFLHHIPRHICQPEITTTVTVGEFRVIEACQVQDCGVQIMNMHRLILGFEAKVVSRPMDVPPLNPAPRQHR